MQGGKALIPIPSRGCFSRTLVRCRQRHAVDVAQAVFVGVFALEAHADLARHGRRSLVAGGDEADEPPQAQFFARVFDDAQRCLGGQALARGVSRIFKAVALGDPKAPLFFSNPAAATSIQQPGLGNRSPSPWKLHRQAAAAHPT